MNSKMELIKKKLYNYRNFIKIQFIFLIVIVLAIFLATINLSLNDKNYDKNYDKHNKKSNEILWNLLGSCLLILIINPICCIFVLAIEIYL